MENTSDVVTVVGTIVISAAVLYLLAAGGRRLLGAGISVKIVIRDHETVVLVAGSEIFRTSSRLKYRLVDGEHRPRVVGLPGIDNPGVEERDDALFEYDLAAVDQPTSRGVFDAFIIGCCWCIRNGAAPWAALGGINVLVVLDLTEERQVQLRRELNLRSVSDATGSRLSIEPAA